VITATDLETFTDELIEKQLDEYHIAGAAVTIVQDGKIELAKGYGYANVAKQIPVSPDETIFRIGSTSKLFTWTAVMQLAEQGKINLNADINIYLPDSRSPTYPNPSPLNLMSHTADSKKDNKLVTYTSRFRCTITWLGTCLTGFDQQES
jgi:CubicO group peptidase (beta-lactamase class C family)